MSIDHREARDLLDDFLYYAEGAHGIVLANLYVNFGESDPRAKRLTEGERELVMQRFLDQEVG